MYIDRGSITVFVKITSSRRGCERVLSASGPGHSAFEDTGLSLNA